MSLKRVYMGYLKLRYLEDYLVISIVSVSITVEFEGEVCCGGLSPMCVLVPNSSMLIHGVFD